MLSKPNHCSLIGHLLHSVWPSSTTLPCQKFRHDWDVIASVVPVSINSTRGCQGS